MAEVITRRSILKELQAQMWNNVLYYSRNYAMTKPVEGKEGEWTAAIAKAQLVAEMISELPAVETASSEGGGNDG